jgi:predicted dehydrogenase
MNQHEIIKWGVLSTAKIGVKQVIPAMQSGKFTQIEAIASRNLGKARETADLLGIPKAYGSYEELLAAPDLHAIYIPLPNHMHYPWIKKCIEAGKHVLCEKPLVLESSQIEELKELQDKSGLLIGEAFMVLHQARWQRVRELVQSGSLGKFISGQSIFSYYNDDTANIRNIPEYGGGGIYDIGCYPTVLSRFVLGEEPVRVSAFVENDPNFKVDRLASVILQYPSGPVSFTVATQMVPFQNFQFFGEQKMIEVNIPFNTPDFRAMTIRVNSGDIHEQPQVAESFSPENHYTKQGDAFSRAILFNEPFSGSLENAEKNMKVLEAIFKSAKEGRWVEV